MKRERERETIQVLFLIISKRTRKEQYINDLEVQGIIKEKGDTSAFFFFFFSFLKDGPINTAGPEIGNKTE